MDYTPFVRKHRESGADITVAALPMDAKRAEAFGVMKIDDTGRIIDFAEKPKGDALTAMEVDTTVLGLDAERWLSFCWTGFRVAERLTAVSYCTKLCHRHRGTQSV